MAYHPDPRSPYAAPYRPPRWPWVFATILLVAVILASTLLVAGEIRPGSDDDGDQQLAMQQSPVAESVSTQTPTPPPTQTPVPTATSVDVGAPTRIAENWISFWEAGDYAGMYDLTTEATRKTMSRDEFVSRYTDIQQEAGLTKIEADVSQSAGLDGSVPFTVTFTSSLVGDIKEDNAVHLIREDDGWKVAWTPSTMFKDLGASGCVDFVGELTDRGRILDRNGKVLAEDAEVARISVVPGQVEDPDTVYPELSNIIEMPVDEIQKKVDAAGAPNWAIPLKDLPSDQSTDLLNALQPFRGVQVQRATARNYPYGPVTAHLVGWVSIATQEDIQDDESGLAQPDQMLGRSGLELGANDVLSGKPGGELLIVECETRAERAVLGESQGVPPKDITLTVDVEFQKAVDAALTAQEQQNPDEKDDIMGQRSAAVIIDPRNGAVLAMVSHPTFDPNGFITGDFSEKDLEVMQDPALRAQTNRATRESYPTGSIFKVITTSAAMHDLDYTGDTEINCPASFSIGDQTWNDWVVENGLSAQGLLTLHQGLVRSCNTVFYQIGEALDKQDEEALPDMAKAFGLGTSTGIPYLSDLDGTIPDPEWKLEVVGDGWSRGDAVNLSIGQGYMEATPLQMANAYAAIANGGTLLQPYVVDKTQAAGEEPEQVGEREELGKIPLDDAQMTELQSALRDQTSNPNGVGSAKVFGDFGWPISGKTGTAQLDFVEAPHSWFAAYGPADDTATIASVVLIENMGEGVTYAAPATKDIYTAYIKMEDANP